MTDNQLDQLPEAFPVNEGDDDARPTAVEVFNSLNGFEELAIVKTFGGPITDWTADEDTGERGDPNKFGRALAYILRRRAGDKDAVAYSTVMSMPIGDVGNLFADDPDDLDPDDPDSSAGKDS